MAVILASGSPRRQELFRLITLDFRILVPDVEEVSPEGLSVSKMPEYLAMVKAREVAWDHPQDLVIGCDTVVILNGEVLGKPVDSKDARRMLALLSNQTHQVVTGCCLYHNGAFVTFSVTTEVTFYPLSEEEIDWYIGTGEPFDKAGSYGIQGRGALLVQGIQGDYFNVVGLPVARLKREMEEFLR